MRSFIIAILLVSNWLGNINAYLILRDSVPSGDLTSTFQSSFWVWPVEENPLNIPPEERYFLKTYTPPTGKISTGAIILITADNLFTGLYVNGFYVGASTDYSDAGWMSALLFNASLPSTSNSTVFAVQVNNTAKSAPPNAAGLLMAVQMLFSDGTSATFGTDETWTAAENITTGWQLSSSQEQFSPVSIVASYGQGIWGSRVSLPAAFSSSTPPIANTTTSATPASSSSTSQLSPSETTHPKSVASSKLGAGVIAGIVVCAIVVILSIAALTIMMRRNTGTRAGEFKRDPISPLDGLSANFGSMPPHIHPFLISEEDSTRQTISSGEKRSPGLNNFQPTPSIDKRALYSRSNSLSVITSGMSAGGESDNQELVELHHVQDKMRKIQAKLRKFKDKVRSPPEYGSLSA